MTTRGYAVSPTTPASRSAGHRSSTQSPLEEP